MITNISAKKDNIIPYIKDIWKKRYIILVFAKRNIKGKIAQTKLGVFIILLQAIILTLIFSFFVNKFITFKIEYPYILFAITGMMSWYIFTYVATFSGTSIIQHNQLISKIYFPRLIIPLSYTVSVILDILGWFIVLIYFLFSYNISLNTNFLFIFFFIIVDIIIGLTFGLWIAILSLKHRDMALFTPIILTVSMFFTPVFYPVKILPEYLLYIEYFNPIAGVCEGIRWSLFGATYNINYLYGFILILLFLIPGIIIFIKKDGNISDNL